MAERIYHPLVSEDPAGGGEVFDNSRIYWPTRSGLSRRRLARVRNSKRSDDHADDHYLPLPEQAGALQLQSRAPAVAAYIELRDGLKLPTLSFHKFFESHAGHGKVSANIGNLGGIILEQFHGYNGSSLYARTSDDLLDVQE